MRARRAVADDESGEIDREEAGSMDRGGEAEDHQRAGGHERRVQALRERQPVEHENDDPAANRTDDGAEDRLLREHRQHVLPRAVADGEKLDQEDGQQDRERIVAAGLDLERRADARAQPQSSRMHEEEHRRGIGRGDDRAHQQRLDRVHSQRIGGDRGGQGRGQQHADGGERDRRPEHAAEGRKARAQAAVEQDQRQRDRAHHIGGANVVEHQAARPALASEHADDQEHQQQRCAEAQGDEARHDAGEHQQGAEQNSDTESVESGQCANP